MSGRSRKAHGWTSAAARRLKQLAGDPRSVEEAVELVVERVLGTCPTIPVDLKQVAAQFDVVAIEAEDVVYSGELRRVDEGFKIIYSRDQSLVRRRFTIAHEIAHAIFESTGPKGPRFGKELERLCDMLAVEILMPRRIFWSELKRIGMSCKGILHLSNHFRTSVAATAIRCAELIETNRQLKVNTFEVEGNHVSWGYGIVRRGPLMKVEKTIRERLLAAQQTTQGSEVIWLASALRIGDWSLEWERLGNRTLFVLGFTRDIELLKLSNPTDI